MNKELQEIFDEISEEPASLELLSKEEAIKLAGLALNDFYKSHTIRLKNQDEEQLIYELIKMIQLRASTVSDIDFDYEIRKLIKLLFPLY